MSLTKSVFQLGDDTVFEHQVVFGGRKYAARYVVSRIEFNMGFAPPREFIDRELRDMICRKITEDLYEEPNDRT